jgi:hypothetical protein
MKIKIKIYDYQTIDGKVTRTEIKRNWLPQMFVNILLFFFKLINFRHVYNKDEHGKQYVKKILDIRGLRTCAFESSSGQVYISQFMFKIGKHYI